MRVEGAGEAVGVARLDDDELKYIPIELYSHDSLSQWRLELFSDPKIRFGQANITSFCLTSVLRARDRQLLGGGQNPCRDMSKTRCMSVLGVSFCNFDDASATRSDNLIVSRWSE